MSELQIALLIIGGIIFIISFFLPSGKKKDGEDEVTVMTRDQIKVMVEREIDDAKANINEIVDETISYAMEKSERAMDRITNEKMLAINEYSDTVLKEINKNQQEVVFLYDMLNNKHTALLETVSQVNAKANEVKKAVAAAADVLPPAAAAPPDSGEETDEFSPFKPARIENDGRQILASAPVFKESDADGTADFAAQEASPRNVDVHISGMSAEGRNNNELILEMHKEGKSNMIIAQTLGLGVGEVKLVIDLFEVT